MPQLEPTDFAPQLVWLAITFAVLFFVFSTVIIPRIRQALNERQSHLEGDFAKARAARQKADELIAHYEAQLSAARVRSQDLMRAARDKLEAEASEKRGKLDQELEARAAQTNEKVAALLAEAAKHMETITADVVGDIVKQLAGVEVSDEEVRTALRQSAKE